MAVIKLKNNSTLVSGVAKAPTSLEIGELAINNYINQESLFLKTTTGSIIKLPINYLKNVTSDVQTQLNGKSSTSHTHNYANVSGNTGNDFNVKNLLLFGDGIKFRKYLNDEYGYDGANIYLDNEGNKDRSKLIFQTTDDSSDSFSFRVNTNTILDVTNNGVKSFADLRAGDNTRMVSNTTTGYLQLGNGDYKHAIICAVSGYDIDDLVVKAKTSKFIGDVVAYTNSVYSTNNITKESQTALDILIDKINVLEQQNKYLIDEINKLKSNN